MKIPEYKATDKNLISLSNFIWKIVKPQLLKLHKHSKVKELTQLSDNPHFNVFERCRETAGEECACLQLLTVRYWSCRAWRHLDTGTRVAWL